MMVGHTFEWVGAIRTPRAEHSSFCCCRECVWIQA